GPVPQRQAGFLEIEIALQLERLFERGDLRNVALPLRNSSAGETAEDRAKSRVAVAVSHFFRMPPSVRDRGDQRIAPIIISCLEPGVVKLVQAFLCSQASFDAARPAKIEFSSTRGAPIMRAVKQALNHFINYARQQI